MTGESEILADNIHSVGAAIASAMFDELKVFAVVDRIVELFRSGALPIGSGAAGKRLHHYWREAPDRISKAERRNFYAMSLGVPGGDPGVAVNRDFQDLWLRFVSAVASLDRDAPPGSIDRIRQPAHDLATDISAHAGGTACHVAAKLRRQLDDITEILSDRRVQSAFGARDMWSVIDHVAETELGGARNSARYRTLATSAATITHWLADHAHRLCDAAQPADVRPDHDLMLACEAWLANGGFSTSYLRHSREGGNPASSF